MAIWKKVINLELLNDRGKNTLAEFFGIRFTAFGEEYLVARMVVKDLHKQPMGIMNGGVSCVLAETVGSTAGNFCVDNDHYCVGLDLNTNHLSSVRDGELIVTAKPYHLGRSTQVWGVEVKTTDDKLVSVNRLTLAVLERRHA